MDLHLGTFNVWGLPKPFSDDLSARTRALQRRLAETDLDLLLIQEAWSDEIRHAIADAGLAAGFEVAFASRESGGGLMALSRRPILANRFDKFRFRGDPERIAQGEFLGAKGYQTLVIDGPAGPFHAINTHVHARYRKARPRLNSAVRTAQLLQVVAELARLPGLAFVGGDFNCTAEDPEYRIFRTLSGAREAGEGRRDLATLSRSNWYKRHRSAPDKRIDYLFVRPGADGRPVLGEPRVLFAEREPIRGIERSLSDHFGFGARANLVPALSHVDPMAPGPARPGEAIALARGLLDEVRVEADRREAVHLRYAGSWIASAVLAASVQRDPLMDRRSLLRGAAGAVAFASLAPAIGYTTLARFDSDYKRDAFEEARRLLSRLERERSRA